MTEHFVKGFVKAAAAQHNISEELCFELLKQADLGSWLSDRYDDIRSGASHFANNARIPLVGASTGQARDFFSALNPFGSAEGNFSQRMDANAQARNFNQANMFADITRNNVVNGNNERAIQFGNMAQQAGSTLTDPSKINQITGSLNTARNVASGIQNQQNNIKTMKDNELARSQIGLSKPFDLTKTTPNQPLKTPAAPIKSTDVLKAPPSANMRKPLFSLSGNSNIRI